MLNIYRVCNINEMKSLKAGDTIIVEWSDSRVKHTPKMKKIQMYTIQEVADVFNEIICDSKNNHYFSREMYLDGESSALSVHRVEEVE